MPSIDATTGRLFTDAQVDAGEDLRQSVEDRILTPVGGRRHRPSYGSLATDFQRGADDVIFCIEQALASESRVTDLLYIVADTSIEVQVNGRIRVTAGS